MNRGIAYAIMALSGNDISIDLIYSDFSQYLKLGGTLDVSTRQILLDNFNITLPE